MTPSRDEVSLYSLVVVGSSAGGIEALSTLVATLPADFPAPLVLAQHLDPHYLSHLGEILARRSALPVRTILDHERLEPGVVYVVPSNRHVEIADHTVRVSADDPPEEKRPKPSVDRLLTSAAHAYGEQLIAVILTGTGSDGAAGARAVKAAGGAVIIENPATAAYPGMPESLAPTTVDFVSDLEHIAPLLQDLLSGVQTPMSPEAEDLLLALLAQVREQTGMDFSHYKRPTILRRLQRRMVATGARQLVDYAAYLAQHPEEGGRLVASFLINVSEFFRDPAFYTALRERVLPDLIAYARTQGNVLRIWSAGCATGEEPYSVAILVAEALADELSQFVVQIFATDLDEDALAFARRGVYPAAALVSVPEDLRARAFTLLPDGSYEIAPRIRALVTFGQHDLGQRAPFPRIDLVLCRNVLIYFTLELQRRALQLFAFALREGGYLALGKAETASPLAAYFTPTEERLKLYRRRGERILPPIARIKAASAHGATGTQVVRRRVASGGESAAASAEPAQRSPRPAQATDFSVLPISERLGRIVMEARVGVVVIDQQYDIQIINAEAIRLLGIYAPTTGQDLLHVTQGIPIAPLRVVLDTTFQRADQRARQSSTTVIAQAIHGAQRHVQITCHSYLSKRDKTVSADLEPAPDLALLLVSDVTDLIQQQQAAAEASARALADEMLAHTSSGQGDVEQRYLAQAEENTRLRAQVEEVSALNHTLLAANQQLVEANVNLRSANEDLLVGREEAEAGAEEIKTLNEEMQATNEELVTVNEELEATVEELHTANEDLTARSRELRRLAATLEQQHQASEAARVQLKAILLSMGDALMAVDAAGAVVLTNAAYARMFGRGDAVVQAEDTVGQPMAPEMQLQQRATAGVPFSMQFALTAPDGARRWFEATGEPVTQGDMRQGGVVTIRDITERRQRLLQEEFLALASHELRSPLTTLLIGLQLLAKKSVSGVEGSEYRTTLRLALRQGQRLRVLLNDLLDVNRVQQGKLQLLLAPVDLVPLITDAVGAAQLDAQSQEVVFDHGAEPMVVMGDTARLEQIVINLLTNAIKYAPHTQRIDVQLRRVDGASGGEAEIQVRDYGRGISATDLPQIFTRYFQSAQSDSAAVDGLGLGLFITKELVTAHGGTITAASVVGQGAIFTVRLPLIDPEGLHAPARTRVSERKPTSRRSRTQ
jgi:two-component system CheB/CheR fusion protein